VTQTLDNVTRSAYRIRALVVLNSQQSVAPLLSAYSANREHAFEQLCAELQAHAYKFGFASILTKSEWDQELRLTALKCLESYDSALGDFFALFKISWRNHVYSLVRHHVRNQRFVPVSHYALERLSLAQRVAVSYSISLKPLATRSCTKSIRIH
jgi:hypothetical protein